MANVPINASAHTHFLRLRLPVSISAAQISAAAAAARLTEFAIALADLSEPTRLIVVGVDHEIYPASMIKTPLAVAVAAAEAAGRLRWTDSLAVSPTNLTFNDAPSPLVHGASATVAELIDLMLGRSDNVATNMLIDVVDRRAASADLARLGFPGTVIRRKLSGSLPLIDDAGATGRNTHPVREAVVLFARLAADDLPGSALIVRALAGQYWNTKLSAGLAPGDAFAHKTGDTDECSHDGGILTLVSGRRYALAVYTERASEPEVDATFGAFMRALRPAL